MAAENHGAGSGATSKLQLAEPTRLEIEEGQRMNALAGAERLDQEIPRASLAKVPRAASRALEQYHETSYRPEFKLECNGRDLRRASSVHH